MSLFNKKLRVSVDLGSTNIKIVGIRQKGPRYQLELYEVVDLIRVNGLDSCEEIDDAMYIDQLRNLASDYHLKDAEIFATLPASSAILHSIRLNPAQSETEVIETIQQELREVATGELEDMQIACHQLEERTEEVKTIPLLACAVPNLVMERYLSILQEAGLKPNVLDLDALGVFNAFYYFCNKSITFPLTIVQIGSAYTICSILLPGKSPFFKIIKLGGNDLTARLVDEFNFSLIQAETLKSRFYQSKWTKASSYQNSRLSQILAEFAEELVTDVKKCIRHFQSYEGLAESGHIYLTGGGAKLEILARLFNEQLNIKAKIWNPLDFFAKTSEDQDDTARQQKGIHLTPAIGTLLRGD